MLPTAPPQGRAAIEQFLLEDLPAAGPPPRGAEGIARAARFFARAGSPQDSARQVHVVGTAGKGTAVGAIVARLVGAGARVGAHLSPHVYDLRERFLLDGQLPSWDRVDQAMVDLWPALTGVEADEGRPPSFFELTTALAWTIGRAAGADHLVTEAGIGGRYDATNTIERADKITVVMPIGYDHLEILGHDLRSIAENKAAVIPPAGHVIMAPQTHELAAEVVRRRAAEQGAHLVEVPPTENWTEQARQVAALVIDALGEPLSRTDAIAPVHLPGRIETVPVQGRSLVLDGAHNPMKLRGLRQALGTKASVLVAALSHEKQLDECARELATLADVVVASDFAVTAGDRVVRRSWSATELASALKGANPELEVHVVPDVERAIAAALELTVAGDTVVATGSFMMLGPVRDEAVSDASD